MRRCTIAYGRVKRFRHNGEIIHSYYEEGWWRSYSSVSLLHPSLIGPFRSKQRARNFNKICHRNHYWPYGGFAPTSLSRLRTARYQTSIRKWFINEVPTRHRLVPNNISSKPLKSVVRLKNVGGLHHRKNFIP